VIKTMSPIYLDAQATTPVDPSVLAAMLPYFSEDFGNPASVTHTYGWTAAAAVEHSRQGIATSIAAHPEEIVFTSGATEANNLAIKGVAEAYLDRGRHMVTVATEHSAVLDPMRYLATLGFEVTVLPVGTDGLVDLATLTAALRDDTVLVSVMAANNEIGVLQPIAAIGQICRDRQILFHTDAAQAIGKIDLNMQSMPIDLMSMTAHKIYGPKGIGALYVRRKEPRVRLAAQLHGGRHERGLRSGTLYPPQIVGFGAALTLAIKTMPTETVRIAQLRDRLWQGLQSIEGVRLNGHPTQRLAGNLNVSFAGIDGRALLLALRSTVALSSGSACTAARAGRSHVLQALGLRDEAADASLRCGIGRFNTSEEIDQVVEAIVAAVAGLRRVG
jgi:cysteine desulfurase